MNGEKRLARSLALLGALTAATIGGVALQGVTADGQASGQAAAVRPTARIPRTPWGTPDLQGLWNTNTLVPLERARDFGTRAFMTEAEHAKALADLQARNQRPGRDSREVGGKPAIGTRRTLPARTTSSGLATSRQGSACGHR